MTATRSTTLTLALAIVSSAGITLDANAIALSGKPVAVAAKPEGATEMKLVSLPAAETEKLVDATSGWKDLDCELAPGKADGVTSQPLLLSVFSIYLAQSFPKAKAEPRNAAANSERQVPAPENEAKLVHVESAFVRDAAQLRPGLKLNLISGARATITKVERDEKTKVTTLKLDFGRSVRSLHGLERIVLEKLDSDAATAKVTLSKVSSPSGPVEYSTTAKCVHHENVAVTGPELLDKRIEELEKEERKTPRDANR